MTKEYAGQEKRRFLRYTYEKPIYYNVADLSKDKGSISPLLNALARNLSANGILFSTAKAPEISSFLILDIDYATAKVCEEIENNALIINNKLLGKVVRIDDVESDKCDVGVAFIMKSDSLSGDIRDLVDKIEKERIKV